MEKSKPFSIQAPEQIAKDYAGNKQKIAEAMQMGVVDPTAGILAGMFIDRMRSAQMQEMAQKPTIAQQVMGGPPAQAPLAPAGGLGATAPAPAPMAPAGPPMEAAPPMDAMPPMGMAEGGLAAIPVPDSMFDEPQEDGMAGGGLVAFAQGEEVMRPGMYGQLIEELALQTFPGLQVTSRQRNAAKNAQVGGVAGSYHLTGDARDLVPPEGVSMKDFANSLKAKFGGNFDVINEGDHVHIEPGPKAGARSKLPERDINTAQGRAGSIEDFVGVAQRYMKPSDEELAAEEKLRKRFEEQSSDEYYQKQRKDSMWETLATLGFNMASSKSPYVLQAIGEAAAAAMPGAKADKKERKELKDRALDGLMALGARNRQRANEAFKVGVDLYRSGVEAEQAEQLMKYRYAELGARTEENRLSRELQRELASKRTANPSDMLVAFNILRTGTEEDKAALREYLKARGGGNAGLGNMFGVETGDEDAAHPSAKYR